MAPARPLAAILAAILAASLAVLAGGCGSPGSGDAPSRELSSAQFDDVPVPRGFVLDASGGRSFSYAEGGGGPVPVRIGRMEYTGREEPSEVIDFYLREMPRPIHGWDGGTRIDEGRVLFTRGEERCLVTVERTGGVTRIVVDRNTRAAREA